MHRYAPWRHFLTHALRQSGMNFCMVCPEARRDGNHLGVNLGSAETVRTPEILVQSLRENDFLVCPSSVSHPFFSWVRGYGASRTADTKNRQFLFD
jgi:hypothetical protein